MTVKVKRKGGDQLVQEQNPSIIPSEILQSGGAKVSTSVRGALEVRVLLWNATLTVVNLREITHMAGKHSFESCAFSMKGFWYPAYFSRRL